MQIQSGKLETVVTVATVATENKSNRLFIFDTSSRTKFLIDTGSEVSVIPSKQFKNLKKSELVLHAANSTRIATYGQHLIKLNLNLRRNFNWPFIIADTTNAIIGADFLQIFHLVPDLTTKKLIDMTTNLSVKCYSAPGTSIGLSTIDKNCPLIGLLKQFPELTNPSFSSEIKHNVYHRIETKGQPVYSKARRLAPDVLKAAKTEFEHMVAQGIARLSKSQYASPLHMVKKHTNDWRPCGDYRSLNAQTVPDRYPIPHIHDFANKLHNCTVFSAIDIVKAYYHIPVHPDDVHKTAVITPFGLFEFLRMPFGLRNAPQTFQRFIDSIVQELNFVFVYLDDILVASKTYDEHIQHLKLLFSCLKEHGLTINVDKSQFAKSELKFLGHNISVNGITPLPEKVEAMQNFPQPSTKKQLRRFLGMSNFYRRFQPNIASHLKPLHDMLSQKSKTLIWSQVESNAFINTKSALANMALLCYPCDNSKLSLQVDASDTAIGAVLQQQCPNGWEPLGFFSKALDKTQKYYSTFDRELLAIYLSIKHFKFMLEGRNFTIFTDHKPIISALRSLSDKTPKQVRQLCYIAEYTCDIRHVPGKNNVVADTLSRPNVNTINTTIWTLDELIEAQKQDLELKEMRNSSSFKSVHVTPTSQIIVETSAKEDRPYIPAPLRKKLFDQYHNLSHPGIKATRKLIRPRYFWPTMTEDINHWCSTCTACGSSKILHHTKVAAVPIPIPKSRFQQIHIDLVGPLPVSNGYKHLLTIVDRYTRWPEAIPLPNIEAQTVANSIVEHWIARFGTPHTITTDRGTQFESELFQSLVRRLGTKHVHTSAYNPRGNGLVERFHRQLKASLRCLNTNPQWTVHLPLVLLGIRSSYKEDLKCTPAEMVYGTSLVLPADFIPILNEIPDPTEFVNNLKKKVNNQKSNVTRVAKTTSIVPKNLATCDYVYIRTDSSRTPLQRPYTGPYKVITRNKYTFTLDTPSGNQNININRLKPANIDKKTVTFNLPRQRGRPKKSG